MRFFLLLIFTCGTWISCKQGKQNVRKKEDYFYSDQGGLDLKRIPLIKPYEAKNVVSGEWRIELQTTQLLELSIHHVKQVTVVDSLILIYAKGEVSLRGIIYNEAWFVLLPKENAEIGFLKKEEFLAFLYKRNLKEQRLWDIDTVYQQFKKDKRIIWESF